MVPGWKRPEDLYTRMAFSKAALTPLVRTTEEMQFVASPNWLFLPKAFK
jgi:hypothetical protein